MIGVGIAAFVLVMLVAYLVMKPFLTPEIDGKRRAAQLAEDRDRALSQVRDLEMEFETGKLAEDEYAAARSRRLAEVEASETALGELEAESEDVDDSVGPEEAIGDDASPDDVERRIAARKLALRGIGCPRCDADIDSLDRFCRSCGAPLAAAGTR